jgi:hypothetical protein
MIAPPRHVRILEAPRAVALLALVAVVAVVVGACGPNASAQPTPNLPSPTAPSSPSGGASPGASDEIPQSPVAGVVTSVQATGHDKVDGFTLLTSGGVTLTFVIGKLDNEADFPPGSLAEHIASLQPVLVYFNVEKGKLVVYHVEDAG